MNALDELKNKSELTALETVIVCEALRAQAAGQSTEETANRAAAELQTILKENHVLYSAILEASELQGSAAALRCKVELQRIARNDAIQNAKND